MGASQPPGVVHEIESAVAEALAKKGVAGAVVLRDNVCELHADPVVAIDLGEWVAQWNLLPPEIRDRRAEAAAVRLINALNQARGSKVVPAGERSEKLRRVAAYAFVLGVAGLVGWWLVSHGFFGQIGSEADADASGEAAGPETSEQARARVERACEAARQRIYQGAALGVDIEGWVVELWLARPASAEALGDAPALAKLVDKGASAELGAAGLGAVEIVDAGGAIGPDEVVVRFSGGYVAPFFTVAGRARFLDVAERLGDATAASEGALYARCAHLPTTRDVGAWYRGDDMAGATAALLHAAGSFATPPAIDIAKIGGIGKLRELAGQGDASARDEILRRLGGRVNERPHAAKASAQEATSISISFPLGGPTRPAQASREIAKSLRL